MSKKVKVIPIIALGLVALMFLGGLAASIAIPNSQSVKNRVSEIIALDLAKAAFILSAAEVDLKLEDLKDEDIQNKLKEFSEDTGYDGVSLSFDNIGNIKVTTDGENPVDACVTTKGYGLGKCGTATLSQELTTGSTWGE
jgi:hypothetical protein